MDDRNLQLMMSSLGGEFTSDKDGEFWLFFVGEMVCEIEPFFRTRGDTTKVGIDVSISHPMLSATAAAIIGEKKETREPFEWHQRKAELLPREDPVTSLRRIVNREIQEVKKLQFASIIDAFATARPDSPSMKQILHIAALALKRDVYQLTEYRDAMKCGKRYNFVPMITQRMLERAVKLAMEEP